MIGARLKQARLLAGMTMTQLADELSGRDFQITKQAISKYENSISHPSADFLLLAGRVLGVPSTYFTHQPSKCIEWLAFRCRKKLSQRERNRIKAFASDVAELQIELHALLYPDSKATMPSISVASCEDAENAANNLRDNWDVGDRPLDNLVQTAEDRGIVVISWKDNTGLFDGLSATCEGRPIAVIDTSVPSDRQRLSLAHEIGHLVMDVEDVAANEEELAFRFAAALLVPSNHAYYELGRKRDYLDWGELESLKRKYGMSMSAWVRRARDLGIINHSIYTSMNRQMRSRGWHKDEPGEYLGDEEPIQLRQMAQRAIAEGLISPDRVTRVSKGILESVEETLSANDSANEYPSAIELLEMDEDKREYWISKMFDLAETMEFEDFEAFGEEEF